LILEKLQRERLQSSEFVLPLLDIKNNEPGNQNINDGLISYKADTLLSFGTSLSPIITSGSREGNEERRVIENLFKGSTLWFFFIFFKSTYTTLTSNTKFGEFRSNGSTTKVVEYCSFSIFLWKTWG
jgi:hypothetical protein